VREQRLLAVGREAQSASARSPASDGWYATQFPPYRTVGGPENFGGAPIGGQLGGGRASGGCV
jgi:hypothetical protein